MAQQYNLAILHHHICTGDRKNGWFFEVYYMDDTHPDFPVKRVVETLSGFVLKTKAQRLGEEALARWNS